MSIFDKFFTKFAYKFDKGYPDMNNDQDVLLLESLISEVVGYKFKLSEKVLNWGDLSSDSRKFIRLTVIDNKIKNGTPFKLEDGREEILTYIDDSYSDLFANQKVVDIKSKLGSKTNTTPLFKDSQGNNISFRDMSKTPDLGGSGKAKVDSSERQEMGLIDAINSFPEKPFTLVGANGEKIENVTGARKMPNPKEGEAYTDVVVETTKGDVNISAKGTSSPSIAGGGLKMASNLGPEVEEFIQDFYKDAYDYYKEIFDANPELTPDTNLYKTNFFKDVSRAVPQNIMKTVLIGIERFGGPVDGYYIGPMTVESEIKGNELITNGDIISVDKFLKDYPTIYAHIKKRSGDYYFTDKTKPIPANPSIVVPMIFSKKPGGGQAQSRFGMNFKPRNKENII